MLQQQTRVIRSRIYNYKYFYITYIYIQFALLALGHSIILPD